MQNFLLSHALMVCGTDKQWNLLSKMHNNRFYAIVFGQQFSAFESERTTGGFQQRRQNISKLENDNLL
jgi:hypothetical protein